MDDSPFKTDFTYKWNENHALSIQDIWLLLANDCLNKIFNSGLMFEKKRKEKQKINEKRRRRREI